MALIRDIPLLITSPTSSSERRITPTWSITKLKAKLEPITGIPPSAQKLTLRLPDQASETIIQADDEDVAQIGNWPLAAYAELKVLPLTPSAAPLFNTDPSSVPKSTMPISIYESLGGTVHSYKKSHQIGRFDPDAPSKNQEKVTAMLRDIKERNITPSSRCHLSSQPTRRGTIRYVGAIPELPGLSGTPWVGVELDEPFGKNDGSVPASSSTLATPAERREGGTESEAAGRSESVGTSEDISAGGEGGQEAQERGKGGGKLEESQNGEKVTRYFTCKPNFGVFVRPERVVVGDFPALDMEDEEGLDEEAMEEI